MKTFTLVLIIFIATVAHAQTPEPTATPDVSPPYGAGFYMFADESAPQLFIDAVIAFDAIRLDVGQSVAFRADGDVIFSTANGEAMFCDELQTERALSICRGDECQTVTLPAVSAHSIAIPATDGLISIAYSGGDCSYLVSFNVLTNAALTPVYVYLPVTPAYTPTPLYAEFIQIAGDSEGGTFARYERTVTAGDVASIALMFSMIAILLVGLGVLIWRS